MLKLGEWIFHRGRLRISLTIDPDEYFAGMRLGFDRYGWLLEIGLLWPYVTVCWGITPEDLKKVEQAAAAEVSDTQP